MLGMDRTLAWMFRCCGISPSGTYIDKYFSITATILVISIPTYRIILVHLGYRSNDEYFVIIMKLLTALAVIGLIISNWMEPERYMNIMKDLESIGNSQSQTTNDKRILKITCVVNGFPALMNVAIAYQSSFIKSLHVFVVIILVNGPSLQHMMVVGRIQNKFYALNNLLADIATDPSRASEELDSVFWLHSSLHTLVVDVDLHFCFFNLFIYISKFIFCVNVMYGYLESIEKVDGRLDWRLLIIFFRQIVFFISQALVCHGCSKEANRSVLLAHRVLQPDTPLDLWEKVGLFSALAVDNKVHFTVGGIFTLDRALITQTALTAMSYLIIAVQLRDVQLF